MREEEVAEAQNGGVGSRPLAPPLPSPPLPCLSLFGRPSSLQDEADAMLDLGFKEQIYDVYRYLPPETQVGGGERAPARARPLGKEVFFFPRASPFSSCPPPPSSAALRSSS